MHVRIPLAALPLKGLTSAVGNPSTNRVSAPKNAKNCFIPIITASNVPLVRNMLTATKIPKI